MNHTHQYSEVGLGDGGRDTERAQHDVAPDERGLAAEVAACAVRVAVCGAR